jgi:TrmH family RNA methyltransferase
MLSKTTIKYIQNLSRKKLRNEEKLFIAEGPKLVEELIGSIPGQLHAVYALKEWLDQNGQLIKTIHADLVHEISAEELERISSLSTPHLVLALFKQFKASSTPALKGNIYLALDGIQDPGNMGTIIRIADWFGIEHIICSEDCADIYNTKVVQSTMGSIARVSVHHTDLVQWLKDNQHMSRYAAALNGDDISSMKKLKEGIIIIGNESKGVRDEIMQMVSQKITIPRIGKAESLNAAVATGIILSKIR